MWFSPTSRRACIAITGLLLSFAASTVAASASPAYQTTKPRAAHPPTAVELYRLSLSADDRYAYTGRKFVTTWREDGVILASAMLFRHLPPALDSTTYTAPVSARGRVILEHRGSRQLWTYIPERNVIVHSVQPQSATPRTIQPAALAALMKNYTLAIDPSPVSVAGRKAFAVTVKSRQPHRPYNELWIDPYTGIVLRRETYHSDASLSSVTYFSDVNLAPALTQGQFSPWQWSSRRPRLVEAHSPGELAETGTDLEHLPAPYSDKATMPKALSGYYLQSASLLHGRTRSALHLLYTDGLDQISVYESPGRDPGDEHHGRAEETIQITPLQSARVERAYSYTILTWAANGLQYSVVADQSLQSLKHFAAALLQTRTG